MDDVWDAGKSGSEPPDYSRFRAVRVDDIEVVSAEISNDREDRGQCSDGIVVSNEWENSRLNVLAFKTFDLCLEVRVPEADSNVVSLKINYCRN